MIEIFTERLLIIPCSLDIAKSLVFHREELEKRSPIGIPLDWPSMFTKGVLPYYIEKLEKEEDEYGWGVWLIIDHENKHIIGDIILNGKPDKRGKVQLTINMVEEMTDLTLPYEAIDALFEWMTHQHQVQKIVMECSDNNLKTIKLYEKLGMRCTQKDGKFLMWELRKAI